MFYGLVQISDSRPSRVRSNYRVQRKANEDAIPHFDLKDSGLKVAVLSVRTAIACQPRTKAEHDMNHHVERLQNKMEMAKIFCDNGHKRRSEG